MVQKNDFGSALHGVVIGLACLDDKALRMAERSAGSSSVRFSAP
jgi:hypothetical protein